MKNYLHDSFNFDDPELVSVYDDLPLWSSPFGLKLLEHVKIARNLKVLDIGGGTGFPALELAERLGATGEVHVIDPWKAALDRLKLKAEKRTIGNIYTHCCCAEDLPFENEFFDVIISNNGINNVSCVEKVFSECRRVCKKGGQFIFTYNLPDTMKEFYEAYILVLRKLGLKRYEEAIRNHISAKRKPADYYTSLLKGNGFSLVNTETDAFHYRFANGSSMLNYFFIRLCFLDSWKSILQEDEREYLFDALESELNNRAKMDGELRLTVPYACTDCTRE